MGAGATNGLQHMLMHNWYIMHTHNMEHTWKGIIYFNIVSVWNKTKISDMYEHLNVRVFAVTLFLG